MRAIKKKIVSYLLWIPFCVHTILESSRGNLEFINHLLTRNSSGISRISEDLKSESEHHWMLKNPWMGIMFSSFLIILSPMIPIICRTKIPYSKKYEKSMDRWLIITILASGTVSWKYLQDLCGEVTFLHYLYLTMWLTSWWWYLD